LTIRRTHSTFVLKLSLAVAWGAWAGKNAPEERPPLPR
jgi:hypothetical protein